MTVLLPFIYFSFPNKTEAIPVEDFPLEMTADSMNLTLDDINVDTTDTAISTDITATNATAQTALQSASHTKTFILDPLAMALAKIIIQDITASTVKWINSGFKGNPAYVRNPEQFFIGVGDQMAAYYLSTTNSAFTNFVCSPFQAKIRLALTQNYLSTKTPNSCTIDKVIKNWTNFGQNFYDNGGWDGWFSMTQNSQNNPIGSYMEQKEAMYISIGNKQTHYQNQLTQGNGFLSWETCAPGSPVAGSLTPGTATANGISGTQSSSNCLKWSMPLLDSNGLTTGQPTCLQYGTSGTLDSNGNVVTQQQVDSGIGEGDCLNKQVNTPGSVIASQLGITLGSPLQQLGVAQSINQIVGALMVQMIKSVVGGFGSGGLYGLNQGSSGNSSLQGQLQANTTTDSPQFQSQLNQINSTDQTVMNQTNTGGSNNNSNTTNTAMFNAPSITLTGNGSNSNNPLFWPLGVTWMDPGYQAYDPTDGDVTSKVVVGGDTVDVNTANTYTITYDVTDSQGIPAPTVTRTVNVGGSGPTSVTGPGGVTITLNGANPLLWKLGTPWVDPGAYVNNSDTVATSSAPDINTAGVYDVTYVALPNPSGNHGPDAMISRTVIVQ